MITYRLHGLNISSEIELSNWPLGSGACDVFIRWGDVSTQIVGGRKVGEAFVGREKIGLLTYLELGPISIENGRTITVAASAARSPEVLQKVLSGTAIALLMHQRGSIVLHASSVLFDGRVILLMGPSGVGKSTTAAALVQRGATLIADDITVLDVDSSGTFCAFPGLQTLRLNRDSVDSFPFLVNRGKSIDPANDKRLFDISGESTEPAFPVASICYLQPATVDTPQARQIDGAARWAILRRNSFRPRMADVVSPPRRRFELYNSLTATIDLREVLRPKSRFCLDQLCAVVTAPVSN